MTPSRPIPAATIDPGRRVRDRSRLRLAATLHGAAGNAAAVVTDLNPDGCRLETAGTEPLGSPVTVIISASTSIGGRIAWRDADAVGVAFCARLLPRAIAQALRSGTPAKGDI